MEILRLVVCRSRDESFSLCVKEFADGIADDSYFLLKLYEEKTQKISKKHLADVVRLDASSELFVGQPSD